METQKLKMASMNRSIETDGLIPQDALVCILLWLPVASLLRFKPVCKSWYSLIRNSYFVAKHLHHPRLRTDRGKFIFVGRPGYDRNVAEQAPSSAYFLSADKSELLDLPTIYDPFRFHSVEMVASCNGIICLRQDRTLCLWNPAAKQSTCLPLLPVAPGCLNCCNIGFGFDSISNDYKVLCLCFLRPRDRFYIYSLLSDSWKLINNSSIDVFKDTTGLEYDLTCLYRNEVYCCMGHSGSNERIITFDFRSEVFGVIPLPDNTGNDVFDFSSEVFAAMPLPDNAGNDVFDFSSGEFEAIPLPHNTGNNGRVFRRHTLAIFRENIGCICQDSIIGSQTWHFQIWMLSDYGLIESWIHLYTVGPSTESWILKMGFSRNEDFLVFERNNGQLCLYDLVNQDVINLPIQGFWKSMCAMYEESLVSINRGSNAANQEQKMLTNTSLECIRVMPEELVSNILLRLPVASLLRFKCVCKSWCALIGSSDFVSQHLHHAKNNKLIVLIRGGYPLFENSSHPVPNASCACFLSSSKFEVLDLPYRKGWFFGHLDIVASCNGIICLHHDDDPLVYFWNPAAKQLRALSKQGYGYSRGDDFSVGFGFDAKMNDYKVVILNCIYGSVAHVYCLSTDSWTSVDDVVPTHSGITAALKVPYRNGIYCWLALSNTVDYLKIMISFDFSNEVFRTIPLPASIGHKSNLQLGVIRECIACIDVDYELVEGSWHGEIWGLSGYGYGIKENWRKIYTMGSFSNDWHFLMAFSDIGDFCLLLKDGELYMLDLVAQETKILPVQVGARECVCLRPGVEVALCKESLVSIKR